MVERVAASSLSAEIARSARARQRAGQLVRSAARNVEQARIVCRLLAETLACPEMRHLRLARGSSDAEPQPDTAATLRAAARSAILAGRIPSTGYYRVWGGQGRPDIDCVICTRKIRSSDYVLEIEFAQADDLFADDPVYHVHRACLTAYEAIRRLERT